MLIWYSFPWLGGTWWSHGGSEEGVATDIGFRPDDGVGYVVLMNADREDDTQAILDTVEEEIVRFAETL